MEVLLGKSRKIIKLKKNFPARLIWVDGSLSLIQTTTKQTMAYRCCVATGADEKCGATPLFSIDKCSEKAKEFQQFSQPFKGNFSVLTLGIWCSNRNNCHDIKVGTSYKQSAWFSSLKNANKHLEMFFSQNIAKALFVAKHWTHFTSFNIFPSLPQWEFQDPKMEVLLSCGDIPWHSPYIGLIYGGYLQPIGSWDGQWLPPESYCPNETRVGGGSWLRRPLDPAGSFLFRHGSEDSQRSPSGNWTTTRATHPASSWGGWQGLPDVGDIHRNVTQKNAYVIQPYTTNINQYC